MIFNIPNSIQFVNASSTGEMESLFRHRLPRKPYCTNILGSLFIKPKKQAEHFNYIQHNDLINLYWLVYDIDRPSAHFDWNELHAPAPNMAVMNPSNGHAHLFYALETPVFKQNTANMAPLRYTAAIDCALCLKLGADEGYSGLISKNPLVDKWQTYYFQQYLYSLEWLSDYLDLRPFNGKKKKLPGIGLGRNCTLFDLVRSWAYSEIRNPVYSHKIDLFAQTVGDFAQDRNLASFTTPLHSREVGHIAKSVSKWVYRNMSPTGFRHWGDKRRVVSIINRQLKAKSRADKIIEYAANNPKLSKRQIARDLEIPETSVRRALKGSLFNK